MGNAREDGHPGFTIAGIASTAATVYGPGKLVPHVDVGVLMIGTNNMQLYNATTTPQAYHDLLDQLISVDESTTWLVTTILP